MHDLTEFQTRCERRLVEELSNRKLCLRKRSLGEIQNTFFDHTDETYIHAYLGNDALEIWIYEDGAMISGPGIDMRYEAPDFANQNDLMEAFLGGLIELLSTSS